MSCLGVLERGERGNDNETSLKEGGGIEMSIYSAFHIRDASLSFAVCIYLPLHISNKVNKAQPTLS